MITKTRRLQNGFVHVLLLVILFIVVVAISIFAYQYVKKQNKDNVAKSQAIQAANAQLAKLKADQKIPEDWKTYPLADGKTVVLPNNYHQEQVIYGTYIFKISGSDSDIAIHMPSSQPSINNRIFSYESYCQLNGTSWQSFTNTNGVQTKDKSAVSTAACAKISTASSNGIQYYTYEEMTKDTDHIAFVAKAGENYFVLNYQKYFNNYGTDAISAISIDQNKTMKTLTEKLVQANQ
jgi:type II secretory pathway pseudopilin PulG